MERQPNTIYSASISYGKDSLAMLEAIKQLGYPLDDIVTVQVWATQNIPADLPEMYSWKQYADEEIKKRYGIDVTHLYAKDDCGNKISYQDIFYRIRTQKNGAGQCLYGYPTQIGAWCNSKLKVDIIEGWQRFGGGNACSSKLKTNTIKFSKGVAQERKTMVQYIGIASDEPERIERHKNKKNIIMPLVDIGWTESDCRKWCEENGLLSPTYKTSMRDGCWFCHNQGVEQLRNLYHNHKRLWDIMLKWDLDSPVPFKSNGHTVHDFGVRFKLEDEGKINKYTKWKWEYLDVKNIPPQQATIEDLLKGE